MSSLHIVITVISIGPALSLLQIYMVAPLQSLLENM